MCMLYTRLRIPTENITEFNQSSNSRNDPLQRMEPSQRHELPEKNESNKENRKGRSGSQIAL